jgi:hypothetical protein
MAPNVADLPFENLGRDGQFFFVPPDDRTRVLLH